MSTPRQNLQHIDTWLFDLDNTLNPSTCNLQQQMSAQAWRLYYEVLGLKRVSLELGGRSPNIVFTDANLDKAARVRTVDGREEYLYRS